MMRVQPPEHGQQWHTRQRRIGSSPGSQPAPSGGQSPAQTSGVPDPRINADAGLSIAVDGRFAGRIQVEPHTDSVEYSWVGNVWRTTNAADQDSWNTYERL